MGLPFLLTATGVRLHYQEAGAGPSLLLMDGVGASWVWFKNLSALSRHFRVVALDVLGTGLSEKPPVPYSFPVLARQAFDVIQQLGLGPTHVIGLSQGGQIALETALTYPGLIDRIITIGATPGGAMQVPPSPLVLTGIPLPFLTPHQNFLRRIATVVSPQYMATHPEELAMIEQLVYAAPTPEYVRFSYGAAELTWAGITGRARRLRNPTLVINGEQDLVCPPGNAYMLASLLPNSRLHICRGTGHLCEVEHAEAFNQMAIQFLLQG